MYDNREESFMEAYFDTYYNVSMGNGPIAYCDDWTEAVGEIWHSYVVMPYEEGIPYEI
jgi:hypothetical protein